MWLLYPVGCGSVEDLTPVEVALPLSWAVLAGLLLSVVAGQNVFFFGGGGGGATWPSET